MINNLFNPSRACLVSFEHMKRRMLGISLYCPLNKMCLREIAKKNKDISHSSPREKLIAVISWNAPSVIYTLRNSPFQLPSWEMKALRSPVGRRSLSFSLAVFLYHLTVLGNSWVNACGSSMGCSLVSSLLLLSLSAPTLRYFLTPITSLPTPQIPTAFLKF